MEIIGDDQYQLAAQRNVGGKCKSLFSLKKNGLPVPSWVVIPQESLLGILTPLILAEGEAAIFQTIEAFKFPDLLLRQITNHFEPGRSFAVRSSAIDEDGSDFSFAGQFESVLFVSPDNLVEAIKQVWRSGFSQRVKDYRDLNKIESKLGLAVIIQEMVNAESAGVGFGIDPVSGSRKSKMISAVFGLGEGLVSGELDADHYVVTAQETITRIAHKQFAMVRSGQAGGGLQKIELPEQKRDQPVLSNKEIAEVTKLLDKCYSIFGKPQDIEFAFENGTLYLLQSRPITILAKLPDKSGEYSVWDNSNIIESYPGISLPLTFSFISRSYEGAYKTFCEFMGVENRIIQRYERVFANTLGYINGRVYYNLKTWYHMLAMLPGYSINARFMEKMMGVKEKFDIPEGYRLSRSTAWWRIIKMVFRMYGRYLTLPKRRSKFTVLLNETIAHYKAIHLGEKNLDELMKLYLDFESGLLNEWKAPLLNDFFAMIWFGMLQKRCEKYLPGGNPNIHNDLLCGSSDIISTEPVHRCIKLATEINASTQLKDLFLNHDEYSTWQKLSEPGSVVQTLKNKIDLYIHDFGERCIGELKLETISYSQDPAQFIRVLQSYVRSGITIDKTNSSVEEKLRSAAELVVDTELRFRFLRKWRLKKTIRKTRELVSARENLRYERTRAFGIVRMIFSEMGNKFFAEGILHNKRDVFYLTREEIFSYIEGTSVTPELAALVELRKRIFDGYIKSPVPAERIGTWGPVYHANDFFSTGMVEEIKGDLKGIGCCPGHVKGKVRVVLNPLEIGSLEGDILVTSSTDPGWVTLFPSASAILVERGSLLSHSAIVSREMGIPCIVGITGLLRTLSTGDEIEINGSTGEIKILNKIS